MTDPISSAFGIIWAEPSDGGELDIVTVSPGLPGFIAMFLLAAVVVLLAVDMTRRIRRLQARERVAERHRLEDEAAQAERDAAAGAEPDSEEPAGEESAGAESDGAGDRDGDAGPSGHGGPGDDLDPGHSGDRRD